MSRAFLVAIVVAALVLPATAASPQRHVPEVHRGAVGGAVPPVSYPMWVEAGERIVVAATAGQSGLDVILYDPQGFIREWMKPRLADRFELNAERGGLWRVHVGGPLSATVDYTLVMGPEPNVPHGLDEGLAPGDAGPTCATSHPARPGLWLGGLWGTDTVDTYRFTAAIGDLVTLVLKPDDLDDGADFDIAILDAACQRIDGTAGSLPNAKSSPDLVSLWPALRTGDYFAQVTRAEGVGNYQLVLSVEEPMPTLSQNDAGTGRDSSSASDAIDLKVPGLYQARLHDGDAGDWYRIGRAPGTTLVAVVQASQASVVMVRVFDANLNLVHPGSFGQSPHVLEVPYSAGPVYMAVERVIGGGNYMMSLAERR